MPEFDRDDYPVRPQTVVPGGPPVRLRGAEADLWEAASTILHIDEPGWDRTNKQLRVGDGSTAWADLDVVGGAAGSSLDFSESVNQFGVRRADAVTIDGRGDEYLLEWLDYWDPQVGWVPTEEGIDATDFRAGFSLANDWREALLVRAGMVTFDLRMHIVLPGSGVARVITKIQSNAAYDFYFESNVGATDPIGGVRHYSGIWAVPGDINDNSDIYGWGTIEVTHVSDSDMPVAVSTTLMVNRLSSVIEV